MRYQVLLSFLLVPVLHLLTTFDAIGQKRDSITIAIAPEYDQVTGAHRLLFGETYRKVWAAPVRVRVIQLKTEKGGLTVVEKGGGLQTKSLKLKDASGKEWVLRSIQKYPEKALPPRLKATIAKDILQDQVATGHPFAALTVPPFAQALGIPHSNPEIVYVGNDPLLGKYSNDFANSALLLEERDPLTSTDTDNTEKVEEKLLSDPDNTVDQKMVLRARLLDLFLGDWDRHEGQWRWDEKKQEAGSSYLPIPRDRDKVYYSTSGIFPWLLSHQGLKSNLQPFRKDIRDVSGYNFNNRYFDRIFLTSLNETDWNEEIDYVKLRLTNELIKAAVKRLPDTIYSLTGRKIVNTLIDRRANLRKEALKYYKFISQRVDVAGTDKNELFEIDNKINGAVEVSIYKMENSGKNKRLYNRVFDPHTTSEVRLYGLGGNDIFSVQGTQKTAVKIKMIGGDGVDSFYIDPNLQNKAKFYVFDRSDEQNSIPSASLARIKTSKDSTINNYDSHNFKYDKLGPIFSLVYSIDQGSMFRVGLGYEKHGFRKEPFAEKHLLAADYSTARHSFMFEYSSYLTKVIRNNDLSISLISKGPNHVSNFFGTGNETPFVLDQGKTIDYYRNRYDLFLGDIRLHHHIDKSFTVNIGAAAEYYTSSPNNNSTHFFKNYDALHPDENVFSDRYYTGLVAGAIIDKRNNGLFSSSGFLWETEVSAMKQLNGDKSSFGKILSEINFYIPISKDSTVVIANRLGGGTTIGSPSFFQKPQLGGSMNLRGFHTYRFTGNSMLFYNLDLRCKLFDFNSYLFPGTVGVVGFNDVGRVWVPGENSKKWHHGYGAGVYIIPAELILIQALVGHSVEGTTPYISLGFTF